MKNPFQPLDESRLYDSRAVELNESSKASDLFIKTQITSTALWGRCTNSPYVCAEK